jgi:hypothetical protein
MCVGEVDGIPVVGMCVGLIVESAGSSGTGVGSTCYSREEEIGVEEEEKRGVKGGRV